MECSLSAERLGFGINGTARFACSRSFHGCQAYYVHINTTVKIITWGCHLTIHY